MSSITSAEPLLAGNTKKQGISSVDALLPLQLAGFVGDSIVDGPGLRCVVFCQGCPHHCPGCHNPGALPFEGGRQTTPASLLEQIHLYPLCRGVTFSGGEPFAQPEPLAALARMLKAEGYELAAYSGYTFEQLQGGSAPQRQLLALLDVLVDSPFELARRNLTLRFRGSENQRILHVPKSLAAGSPVWHTATRWIGAGVN